MHCKCQEHRAYDKHVCTEIVAVMKACNIGVPFVGRVNPDAKMVEFSAPADFVVNDDLFSVQVRAWQDIKMRLAATTILVFSCIFYFIFLVHVLYIFLKVCFVVIF